MTASTAVERQARTGNTDPLDVLDDLGRLAHQGQRERLLRR
jgi:hypothetical protein